MSCTFAAPPGTPATVASISSWVQRHQRQHLGGDPPGSPSAGIASKARSDVLCARAADQRGVQRFFVPGHDDGLLGRLRGAGSRSGERRRSVWNVTERPPVVLIPLHPDRARPARGSGSAAPAPPGVAAHRVGQVRDGGRGEQGPDLHAQAPPPHPRDQLHREQRVAAQLEEVVVHARPAPGRSTSAQIAASASSTGVRGATYRALRRRAAPARAAPCGPACRSASAAARRSTTNAAGTMYSGSCSPQVRAQRRPPSHASPDRRRPPAACSPGASSRTTTTRLAHVRVLRAARASISPSSMRKPRIFTCWSTRPRNSSVPVGPPAHPVAGAVHPRARLGARTDRARSAPPSAPAGPGSRAPRPRRRCTARPARRPAPAAARASST